ncbi:MAG: indolepyruvate ferredoxin oxidoreductase subunit alpha [Rhodovibrionaceae bacterium]
MKSLKKSAGEEFVGEGVLAVVKGLLQSGVSYIGGYQGAPISHAIDVLKDANDILSELGVQVEFSGNEAIAAAMMGASINYPVRGAALFKSTVGTNVASDAISNLSSAGVTGGAMFILGEDYGEGSAIMQERSYPFAMKSQVWLLDPRPNLTTIVDMIEQGFELSEASSTPVMLQLRIRACHVTGKFAAKDNRPAAGKQGKMPLAPRFDFSKVTLPPSTFAQEIDKIERRLPAAKAFIEENRLNEVFPGDLDQIGIITLGGHYNGVIRALQIQGLADMAGNSRVPIYCLNVAYPLVDKEVAAFCSGKSAVLVIEEGQPAFVEDAIGSILRRADLQTSLIGKQVFPTTGEYKGDVLLEALTRFIEGSIPERLDTAEMSQAVEGIRELKSRAAELLGKPVTRRLPAFCTGCPERPVMTALKLVERDIGKVHVSADIGCLTMSTLKPFNMGSTVLGYGLGLAASSAVSPIMEKPVVTLMGDGGFWHSGLSNGIVHQVSNGNTGVLVILKNGYSAATGHQAIPSTTSEQLGSSTRTMDIADTLKALNVQWVKTLRSYDLHSMVGNLKKAIASKAPGLKVIIADGECQLAFARRNKPLEKAKLASGKRAATARFNVDEEVCTGDHSCIRLSGCPSLTIKDSTDPLKKDPVATVVESCVGCGHCGEVAHEAILCPSFYKTEVVRNAGWMERAASRLGRWVIARSQGWT